jgi:transposase-like protein
VLVRPGRDRLSGTVEVDETFIGGDEPGLRGGRAPGKKVLTGIAVEVHEPKGIGRCRMAVLADGSAESLHPFVTGAVEPGSAVITDAWQGYRGLETLGYVHRRRSQRAARAAGEDPGKLLPAVHRVASLAKRWLLGTHQGSVDQAHLPAYLDEFVFRFNRRRSASRGMVFYRVLELASVHDPVRFQELLAGKKPRPGRAVPRSNSWTPGLLSRHWAAADWFAVEGAMLVVAQPGLVVRVEDLRYEVAAAAYAGLVEDVLEVLADGVDRDHQFVGDLACGHALQDEPGDVLLARCEFVG